MPELPDITAYLRALEHRVVDQPIQKIQISSPFLLRSIDPPIEEAAGKRVRNLRRLGKRIALGLEDDIWLVFHLMIAGRLHWKSPAPRVIGRQIEAGFFFPEGCLTLTEAGSQKRASLFVCRSDSIALHEPGGLDPLTCSQTEFAERLKRENHTLKRALTDPHLFSGIGNAYSDEILHRARMSPTTWTSRLAEDEVRSLHSAIRECLGEWIDRLSQGVDKRFPEGVTAFRPEMAVHGKFGQPCPTCGAKVQRIRYADNETNYCPRCQTGGKILADRSLSRLLKADWQRWAQEQE